MEAVGQAQQEIHQGVVDQMHQVVEVVVAVVVAVVVNVVHLIALLLLDPPPSQTIVILYGRNLSHKC